MKYFKESFNKGFGKEINREEVLKFLSKYYYNAEKVLLATEKSVKKGGSGIKKYPSGKGQGKINGRSSYIRIIETD